MGTNLYLLVKLLKLDIQIKIRDIKLRKNVFIASDNSYKLILALHPSFMLWVFGL